MPNALRVTTGGDGRAQLLLLHGLGATGDVWQPMLTALQIAWPGRWIAPDLPGHGGSAPLPRYSFGALAAAVAPAIDPDLPVVVLGHSLGGVVGLALASGWFGMNVAAVVGVGIKVSWTEDDLAKAGSLAGRPVTWFESREDAATRHLRISGLAGLIAPDDPAVTAALQEHDGRWRLALDPAAFGVGAPDMVGLLRAARSPVLLARGENDAMVTAEQLEGLQAGALTLPGLGHNAHVEGPADVAALLAPFTPQPE